ncbi:MAG TPA: MBL fold metallo-hydrolase [Gemmatimonadaceae bacterium]|nr:MBL fold metallo-hydrolase [Gemmatimonadaceae bacterium]
MDSTTAGALARRPPRERPDTLASFPIQKLADGVFAVIGDTGRGSEGRSNAGFIVAPDGVIAIDALASPAQGKTLLRTIRTVTSLPVRWVILTHHHPDHHFGAVVLTRQGAIVIAHPDRHTSLSEDGDDAMVSAWTGVLGLHEMQGFELVDTPKIPVTHDTTLALGGRSVVIDVASGAHTPGDLLIWLPDERVLFAGDLLIEDGVTLVVDGSSATLLQQLSRIQALSPQIVVPGHGRIPARPDDLITETRCYILDLRARMREAVANGVSLSRALATLPPPDRDRPVSKASRARRNAERVYLELERDAVRAGAAKPVSETELSALAACRR